MLSVSLGWAGPVSERIRELPLCSGSATGVLKVQFVVIEIKLKQKNKKIHLVPSDWVCSIVLLRRWIV